MTKKNENEAIQGRRNALKTLVMGAGGLATLPILGQAESGRPAPVSMDMLASEGGNAQSETNWKPRFFDEHQNETLIALTDLIIPETDTPGARAALVNRYIDLKYFDRRAELQDGVTRAREIVEALAWAFSVLPKGIVGSGIPPALTAPLLIALGNQYIDLKYQEVNDRPEEIIQALAWLDGRSLSRHNKPFVSLTQEEQTAILEPLADPTNSSPDDQPGVKAFELIKELTVFGYYTSKIGMEEEMKYQGDTYNTSFPGACTHPEHQS